MLFRPTINTKHNTLLGRIKSWSAKTFVSYYIVKVYNIYSCYETHIIYHFDKIPVYVPIYCNDFTRKYFSFTCKIEIQIYVFKKRYVKYLYITICDEKMKKTFTTKLIKLTFG